MNPERLPSAFTIPAMARLAAWVARIWGLRRPVRCTLWFSGVNVVYMVDCPGNRYVLRMARRGMTARPGPAFEMAALAHLSGRGCPVASPVRTRTGGFVGYCRLAEGPVAAVLFGYVEGAEAWRPDAGQSEAMGRSLAAIHLATDGFRGPGSPLRIGAAYLLTDSVSRISRHLRLTSSELAQVRDTARRIRRRLAPLLRATPGWGFVHGDALPTNARIAGTPPTVTWYDFEFCGMGWRAHDLASFRHYQLFAGWRDATARTAWHAFLRGYNAVRPIPREERRAIAPLIAARALWLLGFHAWCADVFGHMRFGEGVFRYRLRLLRKLAASL